MTATGTVSPDYGTGSAIRTAVFVLPIVLCLALTPPASAQSAKAHYEAGEQAIKETRCVDAGREFELAAKLDPANQSYQAKYGEFRHEASKCAQSAGQLLFAAARIGEARIFLEDALRFDPQNAGAAELLERVKAVVGPAQAITPAASSATIPAQQQTRTVASPGTGSSNAKTGGKPTPIPQGVKLCLQPMTGGFDNFLIGEMQKQRVPVTIIATVPAADPSKPEVCDPNKSLYTMTGIVVPEGKSFSARSIFGLRLHLRDEVQAAVKLIRNDDNAVVWAGDSDRGEVKKLAEHIVNQMLKQRPSWMPSPINR
jgi:hypothetical protein